jgi:hypothetical protein
LRCRDTARPKAGAKVVWDQVDASKATISLYGLKRSQLVASRRLVLGNPAKNEELPALDTTVWRIPSAKIGENFFGPLIGPGQ